MQNHVVLLTGQTEVQPQWGGENWGKYHTSHAAHGEGASLSPIRHSLTEIR